MSPAGQPRLPQLDQRLQALLALVPRCEVAADIGTDHGRLPLHLLHQGICRRAIVSDVSEASLQKARKLLAFHGLQDRARFVQANGFAALTEPVGAVIVSGLGGETIAWMLRQGDRVGDARLLLSAQTETPLLRGALNQTGFSILGEQVVLSSGRYYTIIEAERGRQTLSPRDIYVGFRLRGSDSATVADYLQWRLSVLSAVREAIPEHKQWLEEAIQHEAGDQSNHL